MVCMDASWDARLKYQPCLCLCFGFSQMTITWPFLLMILHLSQIFFTEGFTFKTYTTFQKYAAQLTCFAR